MFKGRMKRQFSQVHANIAFWGQMEMLGTKDRVDYKDILETRLKNIIYSIDQFSVHALRLSKWS